MQTEQDNYQFKTLIDVLNWIGKSPQLWQGEFNWDGDDYLSDHELIELILNMLEQKQYTLLLVMLTYHKYNSRLDEILDKVVFEMLAEYIQETNIQEFGNRIVLNLELREKEGEHEL